MYFVYMYKKDELQRCQVSQDRGAYLKISFFIKFEQKNRIEVVNALLITKNKNKNKCLF